MLWYEAIDNLFGVIDARADLDKVKLIKFIGLILLLTNKIPSS